jgi:hypothetical protein
MGLEHGQDITQENGAVNIVAESNIQLITDGLWKCNPVHHTKAHTAWRYIITSAGHGIPWPQSKRTIPTERPPPVGKLVPTIRG